MKKHLEMTQIEFDQLMQYALLMQKYDLKAAAEMEKILHGIQGIQLTGKLSDEKIQILFNNMQSNFVIYNFDNDSWNCKQYLGCNLSNLAVASKKNQRAKIVLEKEPWFKDWELVATAVMTVDSRYHNGPGKLVKNPVFSRRGTANVGTFVARNRLTDTLIGSNGTYQCLYNHLFTTEAVANSVLDFASCVAENSAYRSGLRSLLKMMTGMEK